MKMRILRKKPAEASIFKQAVRMSKDSCCGTRSGHSPDDF